MVGENRDHGQNLLDSRTIKKEYNNQNRIFAKCEHMKYISAVYLPRRNNKPSLVSGKDKESLTIYAIMHYGTQIKSNIVRKL